MLHGLPNHRRRLARGFSLIEMLVALSLSIIVIALATSVLAMSVRDGKREAARAEMAREGAFAHTLLQDALGAAGTGVPRAGDISNPLARIHGGVLIAQTDAVGVVADLPRPGSNFNTAGPLGGRPSNSASAIAWTTANSGPCMPGSDCPVPVYDVSILFPGDSSHPCTGVATDRTCPWGLGRVSPGDWLLIAAGDGTWTYGQASTSALSMAEVNGSGNGWFFNLENPYNGGAALWPYDLSGPPLSTRGLGMVSTPDRVFFRLSGTTIERIQCWGIPQPTAADWPPGNVNNLASFNPAGLANTQCTPWEVILDDVASFSLRYFQEDGTEILPASVNSDVAKESITRVDWTVTMTRNVLGQVVAHELVGAADVRY